MRTGTRTRAGLELGLGKMTKTMHAMIYLNAVTRHIHTWHIYLGMGMVRVDFDGACGLPMFG